MAKRRQTGTNGWSNAVLWATLFVLAVFCLWRFGVLQWAATLFGIVVIADIAYDCAAIAWAYWEDPHD